MSKVFDLVAALTMDTAEFDRAVSHASRAGRSLQGDLTRAMSAAARAMSQSASSGAASWQQMARSASSAMGTLRQSVTGTWQAIAAGIQTAIDKARTFLSLKPENSTLPGHETGLRYVPYDNYVARLHRGETVLTRVEADQWRAGTSPAAAADPAALADAVARALSGVTVQMDGRTVGRLVAGEVSAVLGTQTRARRYTG
ncbi:MAG: hypothetical protein IKK21_12195 [Clostridia bacterium]|nr:hypothetical protein [Clostridia bacterium]